MRSILQSPTTKTNPALLGDADCLDFHCHHAPLHGEQTIEDGVDTWGIHPWEAGEMGDKEFEFGSGLVAIGECGLDKACSVPYPQQIAAFRRCIRLSEELRLPLILHCVRATDDVLRLRREEKAAMPWVWHGFRGKAGLLLQLLPHGFWFSFGSHYHPEALAVCPADRLFLETDATHADIRLLYQQAASFLHVSVEELSQQISGNFDALRRSGQSLHPLSCCEGLTPK